MRLQTQKGVTLQLVPQFVNKEATNIKHGKKRLEGRIEKKRDRMRFGHVQV